MSKENAGDHVMTWGTHEGKRICDLQESYMTWILESTPENHTTAPARALMVEYMDNEYLSDNSRIISQPEPAMPSKSTASDTKNVAMGEYKILTGDAIDCQMKLNQWKHQYKLDIIAMGASVDGTTILLMRTTLAK